MHQYQNIQGRGWFNQRIRYFIFRKMENKSL